MSYLNILPSLERHAPDPMCMTYVVSGFLGKGGLAGGGGEGENASVWITLARVSSVKLRYIYSTTGVYSSCSISVTQSFRSGSGSATEHTSNPLRSICKRSALDMFPSSRKMMCGLQYCPLVGPGDRQSISSQSTKTLPDGNEINFVSVLM